MISEQLTINREQVIGNSGQRGGVKKAFFLCYLLPFICYLFIGCADPLAPQMEQETIEAGMGMVRITINSDSLFTAAERTVFPAKDFVYRYTFTKEGWNPQKMIPYVKGLVSLDAGNWTVQVDAYFKSVDTVPAAASGPQPFTVISGETTDVAVALELVSVEPGEGTFVYGIQYPADVSAYVTLEKLPDLGDIIYQEVGGHNEDESLVLSGKLEELEAGFYLLTVQLYRGALYGGISEVIHLYPGMTTVYGTEDNPVVFTEDDLAIPTIYITTIKGIIPVFGEAPVTVVTETEQFTGTVSWSHGSYNFSAGYYTATIVLTAKAGYTLFGFPANGFIVEGAEFCGNAENSGDIFAEFHVLCPGHVPNRPEATCVTPQVCAYCGEMMQAATGEHYYEWEVTRPATLTIHGIETLTCQTCGDIADTQDTPCRTSVGTFGELQSAIAGTNTDGTPTIITIEADIEVDEPITIGSGKSIILSGGRLIRNVLGDLITVESFGMLSLENILIIGDKANFGPGGGPLVYVDYDGTFVMYDSAGLAGNFNDNADTNESGGAVRVDGDFVMYGGTIDGNYCSTNSGGVRVNSSGTFAMYGGYIINNIAEANGGGVLMVGTCTLGGWANIAYNISLANGEDNLHLLNSKTITLGTDDEAPTEGMMSIGVALQSTHDGVIVTSGVTAADAQYFFADAAGKGVVYDNGQLKIIDEP